MNQGAFNKINDVLKDNNKIVIPDLQRDYCWGTVIAKDNKKSLAYNSIFRFERSLTIVEA